MVSPELPPTAGPRAPAGVDPVDPGRAGGEQRLRGAVPEAVLSVAAASASWRTRRTGGDRGTIGWVDGDPVREALPVISGGHGPGYPWGAVPPTPRSLPHGRPMPARSVRDGGR